ncbi:hypothetical protein I4U23_004635 [Adineta vaga]|nr:hypothetical protein I4U23_004635 [Adineta vaga]
MTERNQLKPKYMISTDEQCEDFSDDAELNQQVSSESQRLHAFISTRWKHVYRSLLLLAIVGGIMMLVIPHYTRHNKNNSRSDNQEIWTGKEYLNIDDQLPQLRSGSIHRKRKTPKDLGYVDIYIRKRTKKGGYRKSKPLRFPVARYERHQFPFNRPLLSLVPWVPVFVDQHTQQTVIYSPTQGSISYVIPPLINHDGELYSVGELIKYGHASLANSSNRAMFPLNMLSNFHQKPLYGPGVPRISPVTGSFIGGIQTNYEHFDIPKYGSTSMNDYSLHRSHSKVKGQKAKGKKVEEQAVEEQETEGKEAEEEDDEQEAEEQEAEEQEAEEQEAEEQEAEEQDEAEEQEAEEQDEAEEQEAEEEEEADAEAQNNNVIYKPLLYPAKLHKKPYSHPSNHGMNGPVHKYDKNAHRIASSYNSVGYSTLSLCGRHRIDKLKRRYLSSKVPNVTLDESAESAEVNDSGKLENCKCQKPILTPSELYEHGLFIILHLTNVSDSSVKKACQRLQQLKESLHQLHPDFGLEVTLGLGYDKTKEWLSQANISFPKAFIRFKRKLGPTKKNMPSTGGDILVDIRSTRKDLCFELGRQFYQLISPECIEKLDDTFGFAYMSSKKTGLAKDFIGFEDGNDNPEGYTERAAAALIGEQDDELIHVGGSYALTQKWFHNLTKWNELSQIHQELVIGRSKGDESIETKPRTDISHVGRVHLEEEDGTEIEVVRKSLPHGDVSKGGLFYIGFASNTQKHERQLNSMVGNENGVYDRLMDYSTPHTGNYCTTHEHLDQTKTQFWQYAPNYVTMYSAAADDQFL